jgi:hypothetical protein
VKPTQADLIRLAGLCALVAGLCYVFVGVFHPANVPASVTTTRWETVHVVACAMSFFGVLGLAGLYARQAVKAGWLGLAGFLLLSLWMVVILGALPTLWTLTAPVYILGGLLFGVATFRARVLPRGAAVLLAVGTVLAPLGSLLSLGAQPKIAIPTGLALAWLGYALMTERQAPAPRVTDQAVEVAA